MQTFIDNHWRDLVALTVLYTGVGVALVSPEARDVLGIPLVMAGLATLKLPTGNGGKGETNPKPDAT